MTPPTELADLLHWLAPPRSVLDFLDKATEGKTPSPEFTEWRNKWQAINTGAPVPEVDQFDESYDIGRQKT